MRAPRRLWRRANSTVGQLTRRTRSTAFHCLRATYMILMQLSAGVTPANGAPNSSSSFAIQNISSGRPGVDVSSYTINGAIVGSVYYMVDGSPSGIAENNVAAIIPRSIFPKTALKRRASRHRTLRPVPERRSGRDQPGHKVRNQPIPRRCVWGFPAECAGGK